LEDSARRGWHLSSDHKALTVWIDATRPARELSVFGMTLLERVLRSLLQIGGELREVRIELPAGEPAPTTLPADLLDALPRRWSNADVPLAQRFRQALADAQEPLLALSADTVVDARLLAHFESATGSLAFVAPGTEAAPGGALLRLENELPGLTDADGDLVALAQRALASGAARTFTATEFEGYIANLRRSLAPYVLRVQDAACRDRVERFLFWSNYKGSTDFMTRYVYPPLVWRIVRPLARRRVHPNWVTGVSIAATFAAIPLFAAGAWLPGLILAYCMSLLDSVDGKLARLTFTSSRLGGVLDHGLDMVHPPLWYLAWAWALGGGHVASPPFEAALLMTAVYAVDRIIAGVFRARTRVSIHDCTALDATMRTFISRRNVNVVLFTLALALDWLWPGLHAALASFYFIVAWQVVSGLWHAERLVRFWNVRLSR
jgi:phosphatidylglycerophosphate synthase